MHLRGNKRRNGDLGNRMLLTRLNPYSRNMLEKKKMDIKKVKHCGKSVNNTGLIWALFNESQTCNWGLTASKETPSFLKMVVPEKMTYQCQS